MRKHQGETTNEETCQEEGPKAKKAYLVPSMGSLASTIGVQSLQAKPLRCLSPYSRRYQGVPLGGSGDLAIFCECTCVWGTKQSRRVHLAFTICERKSKLKICGESYQLLIEYWESAKKKDSHFFLVVAPSSKYIEFAWKVPGSSKCEESSLYRVPLCCQHTTTDLKLPISIEFNPATGVKVRLFVLGQWLPLGSKNSLFGKESGLKKSGSHPWTRVINL